MPEMTPELRAAIDVAKERIKVDSYYTKAMNSAFKGNGHGYWSGAVTGMSMGAVAGGLLWGAMTLLSGGIAGPVGLALVLGLTGIGGTLGIVNGTRIGAGAGAVAGVIQEKERREKAEKLEHEILASPDKQREVIEQYRADPVVEKTDTIPEILATSKTGREAAKKLVDPRTMLLTVTLCALGSMLLFAGSFFLAGGALVGAPVAAALQTGLGALHVTGLGGALGVGAATGASMGVAFGSNVPALFTTLTRRTADLLSGKLARGVTQYPHIKTATEMQMEAVANRAASEHMAPAQPFKIEADSIADMPQPQIAAPAAAERLAQFQPQLTA